MGGINPPRPKPPKNLLDVQQHCRLLFRGVSRFFESHALLEEAVIAESKREPVDRDVLTRASSRMAEAALLLREAAQVPQASGLDADDWARAHFQAQSIHVQTLAALADKIAAGLAAPTIQRAAEHGLQESLWPQGANAAVQANSLAFLATLEQVLKRHAQAVTVPTEPLLATP